MGSFPGAGTQKQVGITLASAEQGHSDNEDDEDEEEQEQQPGRQTQLQLQSSTKKKAGVNATNALHGCHRACFLQLAQDLHMEGLPILITLMRPGEIVELKGTGRSTRSRIKLEMIEVFTRERTRKRRSGEPEHSKVKDAMLTPFSSVWLTFAHVWVTFGVGLVRQSQSN